MNSLLGTLSEDHEQGTTSKAVDVNSGEAIEVHSWLLEPGTYLPSGTKVVLSPIKGEWYVVSANCCPMEIGASE